MTVTNPQQFWYVGLIIFLLNINPWTCIRKDFPYTNPRAYARVVLFTEISGNVKG